MMSIADYFCSNTKEINYVRNHFLRVEDDDGYIVLTKSYFGDNVPADASAEEKRLALIEDIKNYAECSVRDNKLLVRALEEIGKALTTGNWNFTRGFLMELINENTNRIKKEYIVSNLIMLFLLFQCYKVIVWEESTLPQEYMKMICEESYGGTDLKELCFNYVINALSEYVWSGVETQIRSDGYMLYEVLQADNLFDALLYQMLLHIAAGKEGLDGYSMAECQSCHQAFKRKHGNQKFCVQCSRNSERVRAYKQRKKEALSHAPHP